jgi:hypothetical protein
MILDTSKKKKKGSLTKGRKKERKKVERKKAHNNIKTIVTRTINCIHQDRKIEQ